ncbi:GNAT family N-acetyltransferase [Amycolatopsis suaedae]|uniref:N-acetyltransferase n=1 Tax=Amycolatopsis suaedae TaxID=2510978 RepID=A0A4V2ELD6_9PSEU|nr:GNAT family N-acetyltransferase [Amycolatopsis suaedae]RZQ61195.1 N-acetyltransferase [Amycolatopsis suaedae]
MNAEFEPARLDDIDELLSLYRRVYGATYALPLGTDPAVMAAEITGDTTTWLIARERGAITASVLATVEPADRLGKLQGLVVDPASRGSGIAHRAVGTLARTLLDSGTVDSVYGTARTTATAPQRICLRNGFAALGLFPNLRKAARHETMALLARHRDGVLARRHPVHKVPARLGRLLDAAERTVGLPERPELVAESDYRAAEPAAELEIVDAPRFVKRSFDRAVTDPVRRFYPFHTPNVLIADADAAFEVYVHLSRSDGYCTLLGVTPAAIAAAPHLEAVFDLLGRAGAHYIETLVPLHCFEELSALLANGFLPAALYPAMRRDGELFHDYVVMARTTQPLSFRGLAIDEAFRPYAEQYIDLWTQRHLDTSGVFR